MDAYLSLANDDGPRISLNDPVAIYRDADREQAIIAATAERDVPLGVTDVTVSRAKNGTAPIRISPAGNGIDVHNVDNSNDLTVRVGDQVEEVQTGTVARIEQTALIDVGYNTTLKVQIERSAGETVIHQGEGDIVMGKKTEVTDSILNRSNVNSG